MKLLNRILKAEEPRKFNLVSNVISSEIPFLQEVKKIAIKISQSLPIAFESTKKLLLW